jgi:MFS family permease
MEGTGQAEKSPSIAPSGAAHVTASSPTSPDNSRVIEGANSTITFSQVLSNGDYRNVLLAQFVSNIGGWMEMFAIQMFLAQKTGRLDDAGMLALAHSLPVFILGVFGGVVADRVDRRRMLVITQVLAGLVALGVALVTFLDYAEGSRQPVYWLFALGALQGTVMAFNFPAWQVLTPRLVPRVQLSKAIILNGIQFNLARTIGPALAGAILALVATWPMLVFNAISFFLVAVVVARTPKPEAVPRSTFNLYEQISDAVAFLLREPGPRAVLFAQVILSMLAAPLVRMISLFLLDVYGMPKQQAEMGGGIMLAVQGIGAVIGGLCLRFIPGWYPKHHFIPIAVTGLGLSITLFALTPNVYFGYAAMLVCGFFWIWAFNQSWSAMQLLAPENMRGRVMSLVTAAGFGATAIGAFAAGLGGELLKRYQILSEANATITSIAGLSVPLLVVGIVMMRYRVPEVDGLRRLDPQGRGVDRTLVNAVFAWNHRPRKPPEPTVAAPPDPM